MKMLSLFSGIGAFEKALTNLSIPFEVAHFSEIDPYAAETYSILHNINKKLNLGDITKINENILPSVDLLTYGFPCQPFSIAGKQQGFQDFLNRGLLFFESLRIIKAIKPPICIAENVKNLKNFSKEFDYMLRSLEKLGYHNHVMELNSKDFGSPQNRERIFIVSLLDDSLFINKPFKPRQTHLAEIILPREKIDSKYLLPNDYFQEPLKEKDFCLIEDFYKNRPLRYYSEYSPTLRATRFGLKVVQDGKIRKLTPQEGFRLMGYTDEDFFKVKAKISDSQLWKQLGNSIDVKIAENVLNTINLKKIKENNDTKTN